MLRHLIRRQRLLPAAATSYNFGAAVTPYYAQLQFSTRTRRNDISKLKRNADSSSSSVSKTTTTTDWRDWFRSSDYDDAWSPYYSFQTSDEAHNNNNDSSSIILQAATEYQKNIIPSIFNGTWERRRHGMNLEPICMTYRGIKAIEEYEARKRAAKVDHEDGEYDEELDDEELIIISKARDRMQRMDVQSRFLCRMLDDCYRTGKWRENDRPRTERCHRVSCELCEHFMCVLIHKHNHHIIMCILFFA